MPVGAIGHRPVRYLMTRQRFRYDGDTHLPPTESVLVKLRRTLLSENFHTPMGSSHCWLYAAV